MNQPFKKIIENTFSDKGFALEVVRGLSAKQKHISSKYLYDTSGSKIFQEITELPEYYLTRTEHDILNTSSQEIAKWIAGNDVSVVVTEYGSGDGKKVIKLLRDIVGIAKHCIYRPCDISSHALDVLSKRVKAAIPQINITPIESDYTQNPPSPDLKRRNVSFFLGSNLGNYSHEDSVNLLKHFRRNLNTGDGLLLGLDLKKDPHIVLAAYNDKAGVTADFNLNLLVRMNRELQMNFDLKYFSHYATYSPLTGRAESFLVSTCKQTVTSKVLDCSFALDEGETIYIEQSQKYSFDEISTLAEESGFTVENHFLDKNHWYSVTALQAV